MLTPETLKIELTDDCNGNCVFCARSKLTGTRGYMPIEMFRHIVDECPSAKQVQPQFYGESTLHPDLIPAIEYAVSKGKKVVFYTNGAWHSDDLTKDLANVGLERIIFSIDAHTPELYRQIRPGLSFDRVVCNVSQFVNLTKKTFVTVRTTECKENRPHIREIINFWLKYVNAVVPVPECNTHRTGRVHPGKASDYECRRPWEQLVVKWDGTVVLCCCDWFGDYPVGNVSDGVLEAWNSDRMEKLRNYVRTKDWLNICQNCGFRYR